MKITADTNILVRGVVRDDEKQWKAADALLRNAETVAIPLISLCELDWVLRRVYRFRKPDVAAAIEALLAADTVVTDRASAEAGLALLKAGGDFADGVIAHEGQWLGGEVFASFDKDAVARLNALGVKAMAVE